MSSRFSIYYKSNKRVWLARIIVTVTITTIIYIVDILFPVIPIFGNIGQYATSNIIPNTIIAFFTSCICFKHQIETEDEYGFPLW